MRLKVLSAVFGAAIALASIGPVFADAGGVPNDNACHGQVVKWLNGLGFTGNGIQPSDIAKFLSELLGEKVTAGDVNKFIAEHVCGD